MLWLALAVLVCAGGIFPPPVVGAEHVGFQRLEKLVRLEMVYARRWPGKGPP
jgi:hypothetical protein